ncbi:MAG: hypothetical protein CVU33_07995 [Betaproteobacteria bacterium HGW-Betaproteobacteria-6]|nr:MAG: hypothetical protein CVU33_07995 [Betaproteobacteria bacterium HGW-Betaproteobacteria-6]
MFSLPQRLHGCMALMRKRGALTEIPSPSDIDESQSDFVTLLRQGEERAEVTGVCEYAVAIEVLRRWSAIRQGAGSWN